MHGGFQVERYQNRFDSRFREILHHLFFGFRYPGAIPVGGQRVHVRLLARDPFLRIRIAVQVDNSHQKFPCKAQMRAFR